MSDATVDPILTDLATLLRCPGCGGAIAATPSSLSCTACGRQMPIIDGVPEIRDAGEDPAIERERQAVLEIETGTPPVLAPGSTEFSLPAMLAGPCPLRTAFMSLPYDDGSAFYRENEYFRNVSMFGKAFDYVVDRLGLPTGSRVLDIGADLTWSTSRLARRGWRPVGIDINHHLVASKVFREEGVQFAVANMDMHLAAFADGTFDGVTAFNALHHTHRLEPLIANIARMLKPGGRLGFVEPYWFLQDVFDAFGASQIEAGINENVHRLEEWHVVLVGRGFELLECAAGQAFLGIYERVPKERQRRISLAEARDEIFEPFYKSDLALTGPTSLRLAPGANTLLPVRVRNMSKRTWSEVSQIPVHLCYHLLAAGDGAPDTRMRRFDNARTGIGGDLHPGHERVIELLVEAPAEPGAYEIDVDLVHEGVTWFAERRQRTVRLPLTVGA